MSAWYHGAFVGVKLIHSKKCVCRSWIFCVVEEDVVGGREKVVLSAPILCWGKALWSSGFLSWELAKTSQAHIGKEYQSCVAVGDQACSWGSRKMCARRGRRSQVSSALLCNSCRYQARWTFYGNSDCEVRKSLLPRNCAAAQKAKCDS